jgi:2,3-bisphosphoglycerate-independent phosphoglycerate mutase
MEQGKKYVMIIMDGAGDIYRDDNGRSPLGIADVPFIDKIAEEGICGKSCTLFDGLPRESLVAQLGMFGWDPFKYYPYGRASAEVLASSGLEIGESDIAFRANFVRFENTRLASYNANYISDEKACALVEMVNRQLGKRFPDIRVYHNSDFRNTLVFSGVGLHPEEFICLEPHENINNCLDVDQLVVARRKACRKVVEYLNAYLREVRGILLEEEANAMMPWSASKAFRLPGFREHTGFTGKAGIVGAMDFLKGIAIAGQLDFFKVGTGKPRTDFEGKGRKVIGMLNAGYDLVICHINAPDEASHMQSLEMKIESLENIDQNIVRPVYEYFMDHMTELGGMMVVPDHFTNVFCNDDRGKRVSSHSLDPVPFALWNNEQCDSAIEFTEDEAEKGVFGKVPVPSLLLMQLLTRFNSHRIPQYGIQVHD